MWNASISSFGNGCRRRLSRARRRPPAVRSGSAPSGPAPRFLQDAVQTSVEPPLPDGPLPPTVRGSAGLRRCLLLTLWLRPRARLIVWSDRRGAGGAVRAAPACGCRTRGERLLNVKPARWRRRIAERSPPRLKHRRRRSARWLWASPVRCGRAIGRRRARAELFAYRLADAERRPCWPTSAPTWPGGTSWVRWLELAGVRPVVVAADRVAGPPSAGRRCEELCCDAAVLRARRESPDPAGPYAAALLAAAEFLHSRTTSPVPSPASGAGRPGFLKERFTMICEDRVPPAPAANYAGPSPPRRCLSPP